MHLPNDCTLLDANLETTPTSLGKSPDLRKLYFVDFNV
jgi:hypothetical protein